MILDRVQMVRQTLLRLSAEELRLDVGRPVRADELSAAEALVGRKFPEEVRGVYSDEAGSLRLQWRCSALPRYERGGDLNLLSPERAAARLLDQRNHARDCCADETAHLLAAWANWLPVFVFASGDAMCVDLDADDCIVFLEHDVADDGPNLHGLVLGSGLLEFIGRWERHYFAELLDWGAL